jgi:hypothetical protein
VFAHRRAAVVDDRPLPVSNALKFFQGRFGRVALLEMNAH